VSTTGHGEEIMRQLLAFRTVASMGMMPARTAGRKIMDLATRSGCRCGMIGISKNTEILCISNTKAMSWCYIKNGSMRSF